MTVAVTLAASGEAGAHHRDAAAIPSGPAILLIDGRSLVRDCLARSLLAEWPEARVTAAGWSDLGVPDRVGACDLCVVSLEAAAMEMATQVGLALPGVPFLVLSDQASPASILRAAELGARGYFSTDAALPVLVQGIRLVLLGGSAFPAPVSAATAPIAPPARAAAAEPTTAFGAMLFTPKELEVLRSLACGRPNKLIAYELAICETTVKVHLRHIFRKLGTTNRTHAALLAREMLEATPAR